MVRFGTLPLFRRGKKRMQAFQAGRWTRALVSQEDHEMGGGDLNLKKSWHPSNYHNLEAVWKAEQAAAQEERKLEQLRKEKAAERDAEELRRLQEAAGLVTRRPERVEWLYTGGGSSGLSANATAAEEYLLGKRRFEPSLQKSSEEPADGGFGEAGSRGPLSISSSVNSHTEYETRLREDPLLVIKQKEMEFRSRNSRPMSSGGSAVISKSDREKAPCKSQVVLRRSRSPPRRSAPPTLVEITVHGQGALREKEGDISPLRGSGDRLLYKLIYVSFMISDDEFASPPRPRKLHDKSMFDLETAKAMSTSLKVNNRRVKLSRLNMTSVLSVSEAHIEIARQTDRVLEHSLQVEKLQLRTVAGDSKLPRNSIWLEAKR